MSYERNGQPVYLDPSDQLGFSLKPPKWLRKAQPGKFLKRMAAPLAVVAGVIAAPAAIGLLAKSGGIVGKAMSLTKAAGAVSSAKKVGGIAGKVLALKARAAQQPVMSSVPTMTTLPYQSPISELTPAAAPEPLTPTATAFYSGGGGGGAGAAMVAEQSGSSEQPNNLMPLLIGGVLLLMLSRRR